MRYALKTPSGMYIAGNSLGSIYCTDVSPGVTAYDLTDNLNDACIITEVHKSKLVNGINPDVVLRTIQYIPVVQDKAGNWVTFLIVFHQAVIESDFPKWEPTNVNDIITKQFFPAQYYARHLDRFLIVNGNKIIFWFWDIVALGAFCGLMYLFAILTNGVYTI